MTYLTRLIKTETQVRYAINETNNEDYKKSLREAMKLIAQLIEKEMSEERKMHRHE